VTREVLAEDAEGRPTVVVYRETAEERAQRRAERAVQQERAREVARSLRPPASAPQPRRARAGTA